MFHYLQISKSGKIRKLYILKLAIALQLLFKALIAVSIVEARRAVNKNDEEIFWNYSNMYLLLQ